MTNPVVSLRDWVPEVEAAGLIARQLSGTAFIPDHLKVWRNPEERNPAKRVLDQDATTAQVAAVFMAGQEIDLPPMASLRAFVIIRGQVAMYAIAARALLLSHGHDIVVVESTGQRAKVRAKRNGTDQWQEATWDLPRATTAGLYPGHPDGRWRKDPKAMLVARATAEASRWVAADAMLALPPMAEEIEDGDALPPAPEQLAIGAPEANGAGTTAPAAADGGTSTVKRKRTTKARAALPTAAPPVTAGETEPGPMNQGPQLEPGRHAPPPPDPSPVPEEPTPPPPRPTKSQLDKLHAGLREIHVIGREEGLALLSAWAGRRDPETDEPVAITSSTDLTPAEMNVVLERIDALRSVGGVVVGHDDQPDPPPDDSDLENRTP
jgi:hypothetical protein